MGKMKKERMLDYTNISSGEENTSAFLSDIFICFICAFNMTTKSKLVIAVKKIIFSSKSWCDYEPCRFVYWRIILYTFEVYLNSDFLA